MHIIETQLVRMKDTYKFFVNYTYQLRKSLKQNAGVVLKIYIRVNGCL